MPFFRKGKKKEHGGQVFILHSPLNSVKNEDLTPMFSDAQTGAQIFHEATQTRIVLHLCDGQRGDDDLIANGTIVDQGGPGILQGSTPIPTLTEWGAIILALLLVSVALMKIGRRGRNKGFTAFL